MSRPHLLIVDDSQAILAYQTAALSSHYTLSTASNGRQALERLRGASSRPAAVLLDLSMPEMTGDDVLALMQTDPALREIPVIVVSSEQARGENSLTRGARAFFPKPIRAQQLREVVARVLDEDRSRANRGELAVLFLGVGPLDFGIPIGAVREILPQPMTRHMPIGPDYMCEMIDYRGTPTLVLDLAIKFGVAHAEPLVERKLVVVAAVADRALALCVDRVREPEVFAAQEVLSR
jgi:CheY-like chemotaxis protein/chemotaxis signal transduction protein